MSNLWSLQPRALLETYQASTLIVVGSNQAISNPGVNAATQTYHQVAMGRRNFDDTQARAAAYSCAQLVSDDTVDCTVSSCITLFVT